MLFNFNELVKKHNMNMTGVIHIGAHECGEIKNYVEHKIKNGILVEANPQRAKNLEESVRVGRYPQECWPSVQYVTLSKEEAEICRNYKVFNFAVTDKAGEEIELNISTHDGGVDSIFKINDIGVQTSWTNYQHIHSIKVPTTTLDELMKNVEEEYNFINLDVEGAELLVLKGGVETLKNKIEYIMLESQDVIRFDGSCSARELEEFLVKLGFKLVDYADTGKGWGDQLYIKSI